MKRRRVLRVPDVLPPGKPIDVARRLELLEAVPFFQRNLESYDRCGRSWRKLYQDYGVDAVEAVAQARGGDVTPEHVRAVLRWMYGNPI